VGLKENKTHTSIKVKCSLFTPDRASHCPNYLANKGLKPNCGRENKVGELDYLCRRKKTGTCQVPIRKRARTQTPMKKDKEVLR